MSEQSPDDEPETVGRIAREIRLAVRVMGLHQHNQDWINDHVARLVEIAVEWERKARMFAEVLGQDD